MTQRVFERVRRVELALGSSSPSHLRARRSAERRRRKSGDGSATADYGKTASFLAIGVGLTGVITYVYFLIASHVLSKPDYGQITVLWSAVFITDLDPLPAGRTAALPPHLRTPGQGRADRPADAGRLDDPARPGDALRGRWRWPCADRSRTACWKATKPSTGSSSRAVLFYAASYFARGFLAGQQRFGLFTALILSESGLPHPLRRPGRGQPAQRPVLGRDRDRRRALAHRCWSSRSPSPAGRSTRGAHAPTPDARRAARPADDRGRSRWRHGHRLRRRGAGDHVQRTGLPQRRAADRARPRGRGGGGLHLQRADDRAGAAAALPGGLDQHPPPPHQPPHQRRADSEREFHRSVRMVLLGIAAFTAVAALVVLDRRAAADAARLQRQVQLRPRRACCWSTARDGPLPRLGHRQPGLRRPGPGAPRRGALDRSARRSSSAGTSCRWSATSSAGSRSASRSPPASSSRLLYLDLPPPARTSRGRARAPGSAEELEAAPRGDRRDRLTLARVRRWVDTTPS